MWNDYFPSIHELFVSFNTLYFHGQLDSVIVSWSSRMTLCAGLCYYSRMTKSCHIKLSQPILQYRPIEDVVDTLLHEMIHAYLFLYDNERDRNGHGPQFQKWMQTINEQAGAHITIYHSFHDEVDVHRTHVWKCNGPCQFRPPFYGLVKRSMNRAPQAADWWHASHQTSCGGQFTKISSPLPPPSSRRKKTKQASASTKKTETTEGHGQQASIIKLWGSLGHPLGTAKSQDVSLPTVASRQPCLNETASNASSQHVTCPACGQERIEAAVLNDHLDACLEPLESCLDRVPVPFKSERIFIEIDD